MKFLRDYHVHTTFSDGKNTAEEIVVAAIKKGMTEIGFSDHSYTFFDESYCLPREKIDEYKKEITRLKEKYADKITVLLGIEQDYYSAEPVIGYDYAIGSAHYIKSGNEYLPVDESEKDFEKLADRFFGGDYYALAEEYFKTVAGFSTRAEIKIIGHFDLVCKFNGRDYFDASDKRYVCAWQKAADELIAAGKIFEINTGGIARGYTTEPFPSDAIRKYIAERGGKFVLASDSHTKETLCFGFEKYDI